jgi:hypothetical protein
MRNRLAEHLARKARDNVHLDDEWPDFMVNLSAEGGLEAGEGVEAGDEDGTVPKSRERARAKRAGPNSD